MDTYPYTAEPSIHRLPADAKWENVQYYAEKMRMAFG
jgi:hypothetical protein